MSSSTRLIRFLLDENVRIELAKFLRMRRQNVKLAAKGSPDKILAAISKKEKRVLVTNDVDFSELSANEIFSIIWLRLPQNDPKILMASFGKLLEECKNFKSRIIIVEPAKWTSFPLSFVEKI